MIAFSQPEAFRTAYCLSKSEPNRMEFVMPRGQYLFIGATALLFGLFILFYPEYFAEYPDFLVPIIGWSGVLIAAALLYLAATRQGTLVLDRQARTARLEFSSPKENTVWIKPFSEFSAVRTRRVKSTRSFHNTWKIELVADPVRLKVGSGLRGAASRKARDTLAGRLSEMLDVPVVNHQ